MPSVHRLTEIPFCVGVGVLVLLAEALGVFVLLVPGVTGGVACRELLLCPVVPWWVCQLILAAEFDIDCVAFACCAAS